MLSVEKDMLFMFVGERSRTCCHFSFAESQACPCVRESVLCACVKDGTGVESRRPVGRRGRVDRSEPKVPAFGCC